MSSVRVKGADTDKAAIGKRLLMKEGRGAEGKSNRVSITIPSGHLKLLEEMATETGMQKGEILRAGLALANFARLGKRRGLDMALVDEDRNVVAEIATLL